MEQSSAKVPSQHFYEAQNIEEGETEVDESKDAYTMSE